MVDLFGTGGRDDSEDIPNYYTLTHEDKKLNFDHYKEYQAKVPSDFLHFQSVVEEDMLKKVIDALGLPDSYCVRVPTLTECICFPKPNKVGVYMSFFDAGLRFPLDGDLVTVLCYYHLTLCRHTPISIGCGVSFLSLIC